MIHLLGNLWVVAGAGLTHPWDGNAYLVKGDEPVLIDCGSTEGYTALKESLASAGYTPGDIAKVIGTHGHWDHLSGMARLQQESDVQLYLHAEEVHAVETGDPDRTAAFVYGLPFPPVMVGGLLRDGDVLQLNDFEFTVLHTPGHTPGSVCLLTQTAELSVLIASDTLYGGYHPAFCSDLDTWRSSLDRLLTMEFDTMAIGHGTPGLIFDARRKIREARAEFGTILNPWYVLPSNPTVVRAESPAATS
ncbi:MAG TPA: MBL fold metallo-hydrolase [Chloroflexota bacterium]